MDQAIVMVIGAVVSLALQVVIVVLGVIIAWRWLYRPNGWATVQAREWITAFELLDQRFARGEIHEQEHQARRAWCSRGPTDSLPPIGLRIESGGGTASAAGVIHDQSSSARRRSRPD